MQQRIITDLSNIVESAILFDFALRSSNVGLVPLSAGVEL
jgi:hypothetical protein